MSLRVGQGAASARKLVAEAEAQALNLIKQAVSRFDVRGVDYLTCTRYLSSLGAFSANGNTDVREACLLACLRAVVAPSHHGV